MTYIAADGCIVGGSQVDDLSLRARVGRLVVLEGGFRQALDLNEYSLE